jgi:hypothetical protein
MKEMLTGTGIRIFLGKLLVIFAFIVNRKYFWKKYGYIRDAPDIRPDNPAFFISGIRPDTG